MRADFSNPDINKYTQAVPSAPVKKADAPAASDSPANANTVPPNTSAAEPQAPQNTVEISDNKSYDFDQEVTFGQAPTVSSIESIKPVDSLLEDKPGFLDDLGAALFYLDASRQAEAEGDPKISADLRKWAEEFDPELKNF